MKTPSGRDAHLAEEKKNILKYVQADSLRRYDRNDFANNWK